MLKIVLVDLVVDDGVVLGVDGAGAAVSNAGDKVTHRAVFLTALTDVCADLLFGRILTVNNCGVKSALKYHTSVKLFKDLGNVVLGENALPDVNVAIDQIFNDRLKERVGMVNDDYTLIVSIAVKLFIMRLEHLSPK